MADQPQQTAEELAPTQTAGYKPPAQKTLDELKELDKNDESLNKWKESLLKNAATAAPGDTRKVVVQSLAMEVAGRPDVVLDISTPDALEKAKKTPIIIKEGVEYRMKVKFRVQNEVVVGLKYLHAVKLKGIRVDRAEEMVGSYAPQAEAYEKKFLPDQAPSGLLARGTYHVRSKFIDDDGVCHLEWDWSFKIKKDWVADSSDQ